MHGDILVRCLHLYSNNKNRDDIFRCAFHTSFIPSGVLRLTKAQLDGAYKDDRVGTDFFIDMMFSPGPPETEEAAESEKLFWETIVRHGENKKRERDREEEDGLTFAIGDDDD